VTHFSVGAVLGDGFRLFPRVLLRWLPLALLCYLPAFLLVSSERDVGWIVFLAEIPLAAAVSHDVVMRLRDEPVTILASASAGLRRSLAVLGTMVLVFVVVIGVGVAFWLTIAGANRIDLLVVFGLGLLLLAISFGLYVRWFVVVPAAVFEAGGPAALRRSGELTRGHRGALAVVLVVELALLIGVIVPTDDEVGRWIPLAALVLFGILRATFSAVAYVQLVRDHDSPAPDALARVFD